MMSGRKKKIIFACFINILLFYQLKGCNKYYLINCSVFIVSKDFFPEEFPLAYVSILYEKVCLL